MSRSVAFIVLITTSLIALATYISSTSPWEETADALPKTSIPTRVLSNALSSRSISFKLADTRPAHASTIVDQGSSSAGSKVTPGTVTSEADLVIELSEPIEIIPGETSVYTLTIRNQGPASATGIVLTNVLSNGVRPVWALPARPQCQRQGQSVTCNIGDLHPSDAATVTLDLSAGFTTGKQSAGVTFDLPTPSCTIDSAQFSVRCHLAKLPAGANAQIQIGISVDAQITGPLINNATVEANEADPNPSNNHVTSSMKVVKAKAATSTPSRTTANLVMQAGGPSTVIAGQPFTYTFTIVNRGGLDATDVHFEDALPPTANLFDFSPSPPLCEQQGDILACSLHDPDTGKTITLTLVTTGQAGQSMQIGLDPISPGWPICYLVKERTWLHVVNCELGTLKSGQTTRVQLGLVAIGVVEGTMINTATVSEHEIDLNPSDNTYTATMAVKVRADLTLGSSLSGPAIAGKPLSYTLTVANLGPSDADGVVLTDTVPMSTRVLSAVPSQGDDCQVERKDTTTATLVCRLGGLGAGKTATLTVDLEVDTPLMPALAKTINHFAKVMSDHVDPNLSNNELQQSIPVSSGTKQ